MQKIVNEALKLLGQYTIQIIDAESGQIEQEIKLKNQLTNINKDYHLALLFGDANGTYTLDDLEIKYFGFGDDDTAATPEDTILGNERFRKQLTSKSKPVGQNYVESVVALGTTEANFHIAEIGVFAGAAATTSFNSGIMISRVNVNIDKFEQKIVNVIRHDFVTI